MSEFNKSIQEQETTNTNLRAKKFVAALAVAGAAFGLTACNNSTEAEPGSRDNPVKIALGGSSQEVLYGASCKAEALDEVPARARRGSRDVRSMYELSQTDPTKYGIREPSSRVMSGYGGTILSIPEEKLELLQKSYEKLFEKADPEMMDFGPPYSDWNVGFYGEEDREADGVLADGTYLCAYSDWRTDGNGPAPEGTYGS